MTAHDRAQLIQIENRYHSADITPPPQRVSFDVGWLVAMVHRLDAVLEIAGEANVGHGVGCPSVFTIPKACTCGLDRLDTALGDLDAGEPEARQNESEADQNAE